MTVEKLTKADTVALWRAIDWMALCMRELPPSIRNSEAGKVTLELGRAHLREARLALRKVNAIRRQQAGGEHG